MRNLKILIVDDEAIVLLGYKRELEEEGYFVKTALSSKEGLKICKQENFDVIFVDLVMPEMNGVEFCRKAKEIHSKTDVILISGHPNEIFRYQMDFWNAGGRDEILRKPLLENELSETIKRLNAEKKHH